MQISSVQPTPRSNKLYVQAPHHQLAQNLMTRSLWQNISRIQGQKLLLFSVNVIVWENSRHLESPPWVSPRNEVWVASAEIPYWWRVTILEWGLFTSSDGYPSKRVKDSPGLQAMISRVGSPYHPGQLYQLYWRVLSRFTLCNVHDLKENLKVSMENTLNSQ